MGLWLLKRIIVVLTVAALLGAVALAVQDRPQELWFAVVVSIVAINAIILTVWEASERMETYLNEWETQKKYGFEVEDYLEIDKGDKP